MPAQASSATQKSVAVSCGTLIINGMGQILLCHVTGSDHWDIPKGVQDPNESTLEAARRELQEETGLCFSEELFRELGPFRYQKQKSLHLYQLQAPESLEDLGQLVCASHFSHGVTGKWTPEMDAYRWASREDIERLCAPRMAAQLLSLPW